MGAGFQFVCRVKSGHDDDFENVAEIDRNVEIFGLGDALFFGFEEEEDDDEVVRMLRRQAFFRREEDEETRPGVPDCCLGPNAVISRLSTTINPGDVRKCIGIIVDSPANISLIFSEDFPARVDRFIWNMTDRYKLILRGRRSLTRFEISENFIQLGMFVAVYKADERDFLRAEVLHLIWHQGVLTHVKVRLCDLGDVLMVPRQRVYYLHESFAQQRCWAVRCRIALSDHYASFQRGNTWSFEVRRALLDALNERRFNVRFIRKLGTTNNPLWEVSLLSFTAPHPSINARTPIEKQVIKRVMGEYIGQNQLPEDVPLGPQSDE